MTEEKPRYRYVRHSSEDPVTLVFLGHSDKWDIYTDDKEYLFITQYHDIRAGCRSMVDAAVKSRHSIWRQAFEMYRDYQYADPSVTPNARTG